MRFKKCQRSDDTAVSVVIGVVLTVALASAIGAAAHYYTQDSSWQSGSFTKQQSIATEPSFMITSSGEMTVVTEGTDGLSDWDDLKITIEGEVIDNSNTGKPENGDYIYFASKLEEIADGMDEEKTKVDVQIINKKSNTLIASYKIDLRKDAEFNKPPYEPSSPSPNDNQETIGINTVLTWMGGDPDTEDTVTYTVYFSNTLESLEKNPVNVGEYTTYVPGKLAYLTKYYWKVIANDEQTSTEGSIWTFTTQKKPNSPPYKPSNPNPVHKAIDVEVDVICSWVGGDPDLKDIVTYDVYFGTSNPPSLVKKSQMENTYSPGLINFDTKYYWKIVSTDNNKASTPGDIWEFTIEPIPNIPPSAPRKPGPDNQAVDIDINDDFSWEGEDPDPEDVVTYQLYIATSIEELDIVDPIDVGTNPTYDPGTLKHDTQYHWKVVASDGQDRSIGGPWEFKTIKMKSSKMGFL